MHVKAAIKYVSVHHSDGFMIGKRVKETALLSVVALLPPALPYKHSLGHGNLWPLG